MKKNHLLNLLLALCLLLPCYADSSELKRDLSDAESIAQVQTLLNSEDWTELSPKEQALLFTELCRDETEPKTLSFMLDSGLRLDMLHESEEMDEASPFSRLYYRYRSNNDALSEEELLSLTQKMFDAGAKMQAGDFGSACLCNSVRLIELWIQQGAEVDDSSLITTPLTLLNLHQNDKLSSKRDDHASEEEMAEAERKQALYNQSRLDCIRYLLDQGAQVNGKGKDCPTPLNFASVRGNLDMMKLLIERGADVNAAPAEGITPLQDACGGYSSPAAVELLLHHGAQVNQASDLGITPLMIACFAKDKDIINILLAHGADASLWTHSFPAELTGLPFDLPRLPTLAACLVPQAIVHIVNADSRWDVFCIIFKAQSIWAQMGYILAALLLVLSPFLLFTLLIWGMVKVIRKFKTRLKQPTSNPLGEQAPDAQMTKERRRRRGIKLILLMGVLAVLYPLTNAYWNAWYHTKRIVLCKMVGVSQLEIPDTLTSIGDWSFAYCDDLTTVNIPNSVTYMGNSAFRCCHKLTEIHLPNSITSIEDNTFNDCLRSHQSRFQTPSRSSVLRPS